MSANTPLSCLREGNGHPIVMGILNATPDSFYSASRSGSEAEACARAEQIIAEGGAIIDIGGVSTRPGAASVDEAEERQRLGVVLAAVRREFPDACLSVDTFRPDVARMAAEEYGVEIVNDVSEGGRAFSADGAKREADGVPPMFSMVARLGVGYVLTSVESSMERMAARFAREIDILNSLGCRQVVIDPGYGFGKTVAEDFAILAAQSQLLQFGRPLLAGVSRKRMVWQTLDTTPDLALGGTIAANTIALANGASILRVHDVRQAVEAIKIHSALNNS